MKDPVRVLVVDDEAPARAALRRMLSDDPEVEVVGCCADGKEALAALEAFAPEVLFLDVRMPGLDGFQVVQAAGPRPPRVVFVTAHAGHALEAFDAEAVDYVLKPFDDDRFARALARAKSAARADRTLALAARLSAEVAGPVPEAWPSCSEAIRSFREAFAGRAGVLARMADLTGKMGERLTAAQLAGSGLVAAGLALPVAAAFRERRS